MEKNGRIKKIGCLGAYSFVLFLFAFDCRSEEHTSELQSHA